MKEEIFAINITSRQYQPAGIRRLDFEGATVR